MPITVLQEPQFYKNYGVRKVAEIYSGTRFISLDHLILPHNSIYHYFHGLPPAFGVKNTDPVYRGYKKNPIHRFISELTVEEGSPRHISTDLKQKIVEFHTQNPNIRKFTNEGQLEDDPTRIMVFSYIPLHYVYKYMTNYLSHYHDWSNRFTTMIDTINNVLKVSNKHHYIYESIPTTIPSYHQLIEASKLLDQTTIKPFKQDDHSFFLFDLFKWIGTNRKSSILNKIPLDKIHLVNIVFREGGQFTVLNLGLLNSFRDIEKGEDATWYYKVKTECKPEQLAKRLLVYYMNINDVKTASLVKSVPIVEDEVITPDNNDPNSNTDVEDAPDGHEDDPSVPDHTQNKDPGEGTINQTVIIGQETPTHTEDDDLDLESLDQESLKAYHAEQDKHIDEQIALLHQIEHKDEDGEDETIAALVKARQSKDPSDAYKRHCEKLLNSGAISEREYKKAVARGEAFKNAIAPDGLTPMHEYISIPQDVHKLDPEAYKLPDDPLIKDKSILAAPLQHAQTKYNSEILPRHLASVVLSTQAGGVAITSYDVKDVHEATSDYQTISFKCSPLEGEPSTVKINVPIINDDGEFKANGVNYRLKLQRVEYPIVKISPSEVSIASYYGKLFIERSRKNAENYGNFLRNKVTALSIAENPTITNVIYQEVFDRTLKIAYPYTCLSAGFKTLTVNNYKIDFNHIEALQNYDQDIVKKFEKRNQWVIGKHVSSNRYLIMDINGYVYTIKDSTLVPANTLEGFIGVDVSKAPIEYACVTVFAQEIPVIIPLALQYGLRDVLKLIKAKYQKYKSDEKYPFSREKEYRIIFKDYTLVFSKEDRYQQMILGGLRYFNELTPNYNLENFNTRGMYISLMESSGLGVRYVRELDMLHDLFIDPITRDFLIEMKEPTTFDLLLLRACDLLVTDDHPRELEPSLLRIRGYERMAGLVYRIMVDAMREHRSKANKAGAKIAVNPYKAMAMIAEDPSKEISSDINPIHALKQQEVITYGGTGGRDRQTMVKHTRIYHENDMGIISEASPDNGDVGITVYASAAPLLNDTHGTHTKYKYDKLDPKPAQLFSTAAMLAPFTDKDDMKRVNFVSVQRSHVLPCAGYHQPTVRTSYEYVMAHRMGKNYAHIASKPGKVKEINKNGMIVEYKDGKLEGFRIGRHYGQSAGLTIPQSIVTQLKEGDSFKAGDYLIYNEGFFEPDFFNPKRLCFKNTVNARVAFMDVKDTHEDSSRISTALASKLETLTTYPKTITVEFTQEVINVREEGDEVNADDFLCYIMDQTAANISPLSNDSISTLANISRGQPKADAKGRLERIEVYYNGEIENMSKSLQEIVIKYDSKLKKRLKEAGETPYTGRVDGGFRIKGSPLPIDSVAIIFYITHPLHAGSGDKGVFGNQMKSVFAGHLHGVFKTIDGEVIDAQFGRWPVDKRIVPGAYLTCGVNNLLYDCQKNAVAIYRGK